MDSAALCRNGSKTLKKILFLSGSQISASSSGPHHHHPAGCFCSSCENNNDTENALMFLSPQQTPPTQTSRSGQPEPSSLLAFCHLSSSSLSCFGASIRKNVLWRPQLLFTLQLKLFKHCKQTHCTAPSSTIIKTIIIMIIIIIDC